MTAILNEILKTWWFTRSIPALASTSRSPDAWCFLQNTGMPLGSLNSPFVVLITKTYQHKNILPGNCPCTITFLSWDICCLLQCCQPSLVMLVSGQKQSTRFLNCCFIMFYFVRGFFLLNGCFPPRVHQVLQSGGPMCLRSGSKSIRMEDKTKG